MIKVKFFVVAKRNIFQNKKINYSGTLIWILYPLSKIIGYKKSKILSDFFDKNLPKWMSFKFIMEAKKIS